MRHGFKGSHKNLQASLSFRRSVQINGFKRQSWKWVWKKASFGLTLRGRIFNTSQTFMVRVMLLSLSDVVWLIYVIIFKHCRKFVEVLTEASVLRMMSTATSASVTKNLMAPTVKSVQYVIFVLFSGFNILLIIFCKHLFQHQFSDNDRIKKKSANNCC